MSYMDGLPWIKWDDEYSTDYKIIIQKLPQFQSAEERLEKIEIKGRDGSLYYSEESYKTYQTTCEMTMLDDTMRSEIFAWLRGSGLLISSDDPDHAVKARIISKIDPARIVPGVKSIIVTFECQPFRYEVSPETIVLTSSGTINNPGNADSYPAITVNGTGTLTIDSDAYVFSESGVTMNSEIEECYAGTISKNSTVSGGFPTLAPGIHTITLGAGITSVSIQPNARWY